MGRAHGGHEIGRRVRLDVAAGRDDDGVRVREGIKKRVPEIRVCMNEKPLRDLRAPQTPPPTAVDADGSSAQTFLVDVVARRGGETRRASASGRDI
ncbi:hypothetical protein [Streptomyces sp. NBC_01310]|uniref:hypothetical protein n=1 Tax=Streptomyces sp. NBC_01310 TaxID=2903820 RepID=UPI0035B617DB